MKQVTEFIRVYREARGLLSELRGTISNGLIGALVFGIALGRLIGAPFGMLGGFAWLAFA